MAKAKTSAASPDNTGELLVYLGPNLRTAEFMLQTFQTFYAIPAAVAGKRSLKHFFVPLAGMHAAKQELNVPGSRLANLYAKALAEFSKGGN